MDKRRFPDRCEKANRRRRKRLNKVVALLDEGRHPLADGGVCRKIHCPDNPVQIFRDEEVREITRALTDVPEEALEWNEPRALEKKITHRAGQPIALPELRKTELPIPEDFAANMKAVSTL
jgi:hypothetical protein